MERHAPGRRQRRCLDAAARRASSGRRLSQAASSTCPCSAGTALGAAARFGTSNAAAKPSNSIAADSQNAFTNALWVGNAPATTLAVRVLGGDLAPHPPPPLSENT